MNNFFSKIGIISCQKYTELASRVLDGEELSTGEKVAYKMHHIMCFMCRRFCKQIHLIDDAYKACCEQEHEELSPDAHTRISSEIQKIIN